MEEKPDPSQNKADQQPKKNGEDSENPFSGAGVANTWAKAVGLGALLVGLLWCVLAAGLGGLSHNVPFQADANFALFAAFIVVAGAIERIIQPLTAILPPFKQQGKDKDEEAKLKADRTLVAYGIALIVGIAVSSAFGLYFLETMGVEIGTVVTHGDASHVTFHGDGEKILRGFDILSTALIITGGTKPLHDMITSIEKKKEKLAGQ